MFLFFTALYILDYVLEWVPFMCQFSAFVHPQMLSKTDSRALSQADWDRKTEEQALRRAGRLRGLQELTGSGVKTLTALGVCTGAFFFQFLQTIQTTNNYFSVCQFDLPTRASHSEASCRTSQQKAVRRLRGPKVWQLSSQLWRSALAEQISIICSHRCIRAAHFPYIHMMPDTQMQSEYWIAASAHMCLSKGSV